MERSTTEVDPAYGCGRQPAQFEMISIIGAASVINSSRGLKAGI